MSPRVVPIIQTKGLVDSDRLREAIRLIREGGPEGVTREALRKGLGDVSLRTVDRAVALLEEQGAQIQRQRRGWPSVLNFILKKGPAWDEHVTSEARLALELAMLSLAQSGTLLWQDKLKIIESLATGKMSTRDRMLFDQLRKAVHVQGGVDDPVDPVEGNEILERILRGLEGPRELEIAYQSADSDIPAVHAVVPYTLTHDLFSGGTFLLVWEPSRRLPLHLRLNRIDAVKVGRVSVIPDEGLMKRAARYQIGGWMSGRLPFQVEARIQGTHWLRAFREAPPALPDFESDPTADGCGALVKFKANHELGALRWLQQFGASVEVLRPAELRKKIHLQLIEACGQYEGADSPGRKARAGK
ncbi:MAG TPA: WYL domain-containing protein [Holophaga sp.]|nr:WYL domain-containing protein [Holophaga sp.]HPS68556.1 WYL domain-containing protein [Holophaga sp.]